MAKPKARNPASKKERSTPRSGARLARLVLLAAFAIALAHTDAVIAAYLHEGLGLVAQGGGGELSEVEDLPGWVIAVQQTRQAAIAVVLVSVAMLAGRGPAERIGALLFAAGLRQLAYYVALKFMTSWPQVLRSLDMVLTIPGPVFAPVWAVCLVAVACAALGLVLMRRAAPGR